MNRSTTWEEQIALYLEKHSPQTRKKKTIETTRKWNHEKRKS